MSKPADSLSIEETEKLLWEVIKSIPGINVTYGSVRCIVYAIKKDDKEASASALACAKGAVQTAVLTAEVVTAPVSIPLAAGGALTGIAAKSVTDTVEIIVFFVTNSEQFHDKKNDERERLFYDKIKNVIGIGALYSGLRVPVYLLKRNKQQTIDSGISLVDNSGETAVEVGVSMIPNVDPQMQKLIQKTARYAIRYLAKKTMDQISREDLPMEEGLHTLAKVENDCQTIIEATMSQGIREVPKEATTENEIQPNQCISKAPEEVEQGNGILRSIFCCCCTRKRSHNTNRGKVKPKDSDIVPPCDVQNDDNPGSNISAELDSNGHLIILTD